jgi:hypothetical protein
MATHILGIRHHGPGSAARVRDFLEELTPDIVLVEGPPEADHLLQWVSHEGLKPPVALLCYQPDDPSKSVFYPFAEFSPEWQAVQYARRKNIHVRFMDLPAGNQVAYKETGQEGPNPLSYLSGAAGFSNDEQWWEHTFEYRTDHNEPVFDAVAEAMQALRETLPSRNEPLEELREAYMRKVIRQADKEMFHTIAVICGAWHVPALQAKIPQKQDQELLKNLGKVKTECTWIPWTFNRLSFQSGYGAGIHSPGWYSHLWHNPADDGTLWMAKVAQLFRAQNMDTSVAHIIEAVRLAGSLASLRGLPRVGLEELNEATLSVLCNGEGIMMQLVGQELIVGHEIGEVPADIPKPPLQLDIDKLQKKLRLPATADFKDYTFDLRKENDLERSLFLHRLRILDISWGVEHRVSGKGTFKEQWRLQWDPEFAVSIIEKGNLGNTVVTAAGNAILQKSSAATGIKELSSLLEQSIPAGLPEVISTLLEGLDRLAAASADVMELMEVVPGLITVARYGNVRNTDSTMVTNIIESMVTRICISLPNACVAVNEEASLQLLDLLFELNDGLNLLAQKQLLQNWQTTLQIIASQSNTSAVIAGYSTRLLHDARIIADEVLAQLFSYAMSAAAEPVIVAAWIEGFLRGSGTLLLLDQQLWNLIDNWIAGLDEGSFMQVLPLLRRTFANFSSPERRKLGEKAKMGVNGNNTIKLVNQEFDHDRAALGIPVVLELLGLNLNTN